MKTTRYFSAVHLDYSLVHSTVHWFYSLLHRAVPSFFVQTQRCSPLLFFTWCIAQKTKRKRENNPIHEWPKQYLHKNSTTQSMDRHLRHLWLISSSSRRMSEETSSIHFEAAKYGDDIKMRALSRHDAISPGPWDCVLGVRITMIVPRDVSAF